MSQAFHYEKNPRSREGCSRSERNKGKHTIKLLPKNGFGLPPPHFVHALSFSLEETGTDQTNPVFWRLQNWLWRGHFIVRPPPQKKPTTRFAPPPFAQRVLNGVFQTVFFGCLTSACDRGNPLWRDKECLQTPVFSSILVPSALVDPHHPSEHTTLKNTV